MSSEKNKALRSIFKGASIVFIGIAISKVLALAFRVLVGRALGPEDYGIISVMMAVFSSALVFGHMGINKGIQRYVSYHREEDKEKMLSYARTGFLLILIPSTTVALILFASAPWISVYIFNEPKLIWPIRMAALAIPFWGIARCCIAITNALEKMQYKVYISRIWANASEVALAFLLVYIGYGYLGAAFAYAFGFASASVLGLYYVRKIYPELFSGKKTSYNFRELWQYSWPLFAASTFGILTSHIDTFMLQYFTGSESVGFYQAAYPFAALLLIGKSAFSSIFLSRASFLASKSEKDLAETFKTIIKWVFMITIPVFLLLIAYPRSVLVLFGEQYYTVENVLRILLLGFLIHAVIAPAKEIYQAVGRTKIITTISIILGGFNIVLNAALIPLYGITGAAIATAASFILIFIVKLFYIHKITGEIPFKKSIAKVFISGLLTIGIILSISHTLFETAPEWFIIPAFLLFALLYPLLLILTRSLEEDDLEIINTIEKKFPRLHPLVDIIRRLLTIE